MIDLSDLDLKTGAHDVESGDCCVMEAAAILGCALKAPEPVPTWTEALARFRFCKTDHPADACRVVSAFLRRLNDRWPDSERQRLKPYALQIVGTRVSVAVEVKRAYVMADAAVRIFAPIALDARWPEHAAALRACAPITDTATAEAGRKVARAAASVAASADAAAYAYAAASASAAAAYADADASAASAAAAAADAAAAAADAAADAAAYAYAAASASAAAAASAADAAAYAYADAASRLVNEALEAVDKMLAITA